MSEQMVTLGSMPQRLLDDIVQRLRQHTVAFVDLIATNQEHGLIGSGTLVAAGSSRAILTAHHVAERLPETGRVGLLLEPTPVPQSVDREGVAVVDIAPRRRGQAERDGPDLAAVILAPPLASAVGAKKVFYNLDARVDELRRELPDIHAGFWFAQGFLAERTEILANERAKTVIKRFFNFTAIGGPDERMVVGEYDYFDFPVTDLEAREAVTSWGGMSGGGLWQVPLVSDGAELSRRPPLLAGVNYYQHPTTPTSCGIRCHAWNSVYRIAYPAIHGRR